MEIKNAPRPTIAVLQEKILTNQTGAPVIREGTNRITSEGKRIASSIFTSVLEEGRSPEDIRQSVQEIRAGLRVFVADHKKNLKSQIRTNLEGQGLRQKGQSREFQAMVRQQFSEQLGRNSALQAVSEARKLLTSINQRARDEQDRQAVLNTQNTQEEQPTNIINLNAVIERRVRQERAVTQQTLSRLGWRTSFSGVARLALAALSVLGINTQVNYQQNRALEVALAPSNAVVQDVPIPSHLSLTPEQTIPINIPPVNEPTLKPLIPNPEKTPIEEEIRAAVQRAFIKQPKTTLAPKSTPVEIPANPKPPVKEEKKVDHLDLAKEKIKTIVEEYKEKDIDVTLSVRDVATGKSVLEVNPDKVNLAASTAKVYTAAAILDGISKGNIRSEQKMGNTTVGEALKKMVNQSDNDSWMLFYRTFGRIYIQDFARTHGATNFDLPNNTTTTNELATFLSNLYGGKILPSEQTKLLLSWMKAGTTSRENLLSPSMEGHPFYHKWGLFRDMVADAGIVVVDGKPYAVVIMAGGKPFMEDDEKDTITDYSGLENRENAIRKIGPVLTQGLSQTTPMAKGEVEQKV